MYVFPKNSSLLFVLLPLFFLSCFAATGQDKTKIPSRDMERKDWTMGKIDPQVEELAKFQEVLELIIYLRPETSSKQEQEFQQQLAALNAENILKIPMQKAWACSLAAAKVEELAKNNAIIEISLNAEGSPE